MTLRSLTLPAVFALFLAATPMLAAADTMSKTSPAAEATYADIQKTLGSVPSFFKMFPPDAVPGAWATMKALQLGTTEIPGKYKELIGLGVAAQIPCEYCIYFHTEAAKLGGATEAEVREAVATAGLTRFWSTVVNGSGQDLPEFRDELRRVVEHLRSGKGSMPMGDATDAASAREQMKAMFGFVPTFFGELPEGTIAPAWNEYKALGMNPNGAIPNKYKLLLGLGVAAQTPCSYCVAADRAFAGLEGATDAEMKEAIGIAAITRHWSAFLNGLAVDPVTFRRETDTIVKAMKGQVAKK